MTLIVQVPNNYLPERKYIIKLILDEYLGIPSIIKKTNTDKVIISAACGQKNKKIILEDNFFSATENEWLKPTSLPNQPIKWWDLNGSLISLPCKEKKVPVVFGADPLFSDFYRVDKDGIYLGLDVFGSSFFMLTRYEELVKPDRDEHDRFPASSSLAYQEGFLNRPIIDEYVEILWQCMKIVWPGLQRMEKHFRTYISHDIDLPYLYYNVPVNQIIKACIGDIVKRRHIPMSVDRIQNWVKVNREKLDLDPYNTYDYLMELSEKNGWQSTFYFQVNAGNRGSRDGIYNFTSQYIKELLLYIYNRGHLVGLHPSYKTYKNTDLLRKQLEIFQKTIDQVGIKQEHIGARQHYLRWILPDTWQTYEDVGINYDTTLCYADYSGFRCGTSHEYPVFNILKRKRLLLTERPLVIMDCSMLSDKYMGLTYESALIEAKKLVTKCKRYDGAFSLLWHNSSLVKPEDRELYQLIIEHCSRQEVKC